MKKLISFWVKKLKNFNFFNKYFILVTFLKYYNKRNSLNINLQENKFSEEETIIENSLQSKGYFIKNNFLTKTECSQIINSIDYFILNKKNLISCDEQQSDFRIYGAENINESINNFANNKFLKKIGIFFTRENLDLFMCMANKVVFKENNLGSGGGWHKDSYKKQFKCILYLNDVTMENGPFQFIKNSENFYSTSKMLLKLSRQNLDTRFSENDILKIIEKKNEKIVSLIAPAGSLIFVNTSLIHRGAPINKGMRYALTNYYYPKDKFENYKYHFKPLLKSQLF